jgi:predicted O-methyltransferase YrrM
VDLPPLDPPRLDPTPIFEFYRAGYGSELLVAAVLHLQVVDAFFDGPLTPEELRAILELAPRPASVVLTTLRAFGLIVADGQGKLDLSELAREHLLAGSPFSICGYLGLSADSPGVRAMVERLRTNRPAGTASDEPGAAFIYRSGIRSAMENDESARRLTLALAGRARNVAPVLAARMPLDGATTVLDVGGGTGIYSVALLRKNPNLRAIVWDRPQVLKVAAELATAYEVSDRMECVAGDMFVDPPPKADVVLLSNVLHDWDVPACEALVQRCATALSAGGRMLIHDVFLNDDLDGPLPVALYSIALFCQTEGRAYSAAEYCSWLRNAGLTPGPVEPTLIHCAVLPAVKS